MAWVWHHGFETGLAYTGYKNSISTSGAYGASGWIVIDDGSSNYPDFASTTVHPSGSATGGAESAYALKLDRVGQKAGPMSLRSSVSGTAQDFSGISVSFAFRAEGTVSSSGDPLAVIRRLAGGASQGFSIPPIASTGDFSLGLSLATNGSAPISKTIPTPLNSNTWYWITVGAYSHGGNKYYRLYINGVLEVQTSSSGSGITWSTFEFGSPGVASVQDFFFDDVVVYNKPEIFSDLDATNTDPCNQPHHIFGLPTARVVDRGNFSTDSGSIVESDLLTTLQTKNLTTYLKVTTATAKTLKLNVKSASAVINTEYIPPTIVAVSASVPLQMDGGGTAECGVVLLRDGVQKSATGIYGASTRTEGYGGTATFDDGVLMQVPAYGAGFSASDVIELADIDHANLTLEITVAPSSAFTPPRLYFALVEVLWSKKRRATKASTRTDVAPKTALIFQDPELLKDNKDDTTATVGYSFTQRSPLAGITSPSSSNDGSMLAFLQGDWNEDKGEINARIPQDINLQVCQSGGMLSGSEWMWGYKQFPETPESTNYMGYSDPKLPWVTYEPFSNGTATLGAGGGVGEFLEVAYSSKFDRVLFFRLRAGQFEIAYKNNSMYGTYDSGYETIFSYAKLSQDTAGHLNTSGTNVTNYMRDLTTGNWGFSIVETDDGIMHLFIGYTTPKHSPLTAVGTLDASDIARYTSDDGGLNWMFEEDGILEKYYEGPTLSDFFQVAVSGNWFYMGLMELNISERTRGFYSLISSNQGASWVQGYPADSATGADDPNIQIREKQGYPGNLASSAVADGDAVFSICGSPTGDGTFIVYAGYWGSSPDLTVGSRVVQVFTAYRTGKLQAVTTGSVYLGTQYSYYNTLYTPQSMCAVAGPSDVFVFANGYLEGFDASSGIVTDMGWVGSTSRIIPINKIEDISIFGNDGTSPYYINRRTEGSWSAYSGREQRDYLGMMGSQAYTPSFIRGVWAGDRIITAHRAYGPTDTNTALEGTRVQEWGGWSYKPIRSENPWASPFPNGMACAYWNASMGCPNGSATSATMPVSASRFWSSQRVSSGSGAATIEIDNEDLLLEITSDLDNVNNRSNLNKVFPANSTAGITQSIGSRGLIAWTVNLDQMQDGLSPASPTWTATTSYTSALADNGPITGVSARIVNSFNGTVGATRQAVVTVDMVRSGSNFVFHVYDSVAGTSLCAITKGTYNSTMDCRLSLYDDRHRNSAAGTTNQYCELSVGLHGVRYPQWVSSGMLTLSYETMSNNVTEQEAVWFGNLGIGPTPTGSSTPVVSEWSQFIVSRLNQGGSLSQVDWNQTTNNRGFPCTPYGQDLAQGISARWGGDSAMARDNFVGNIEFQYGINKLPLASKRFEWRSNNLGSGATETLAWRAGNADDDGYVHSFSHRAFSVWGANTRLLTLNYQYPGASTTISIDLLEHTSSIVSLGDTGATATMNSKQSFQVPNNDARAWRENELAGKYVDIEALDGNKRSYIISGNRGNLVSITGLNTLMQNVISPLSTLFIYSGNKTVFFAEDMEYNQMSLAMTAGGTNSTNPNPPEGYFKISNIVAGMTLPFSVPLDWNSSLSEKGNVSVYTATSGVRSAYKQGSPRKTFSGQIRGDTEEWRTSLRSMVNKISEYSKNPLVLCLDTSSPSDDNTIYCRFTADTSDKNVGWAYSEVSNKWYQVGDTTVKFEEEI